MCVSPNSMKVYFPNLGAGNLKVCSLTPPWHAEKRQRGFITEGHPISYFEFSGDRAIGEILTTRAGERVLRFPPRSGSFQVINPARPDVVVCENIGCEK